MNQGEVLDIKVNQLFDRESIGIQETDSVYVCMYVCMYRCLVRDTLTTTMDFSGSLMLKMLVKKEKEKSKC